MQTHQPDYIPLCSGGCPRAAEEGGSQGSQEIRTKKRKRSGRGGHRGHRGRRGSHGTARYLLAETAAIMATDDIHATLSGIRSFADIVALESRRDALDPQIPQIRQLLAMIPGARAIEDLVGLEQPKKQLFEVLIAGLLRRLLPASHVKGRGGFNNMVLLGPPGVGKTSLLRAFGTLCEAGGVTRCAKVTFAFRNNMVGQYLGSSAVMTTELVEGALGGLLVIDEVYALGSTEHRDSFAKEAIDTLTFLMDKYRDDLIVAVAGYPEDVRCCFLQQNIGLERRFTHWMTLDPYTPEQLAEIFARHCATRGWQLPPEARERIRACAPDMSHYASDAVAMVTHLELITAHRLWVGAAALPRATVLAAQEAARNPAELETPQVGEVDVTSLEMVIRPSEVNEALQRLLAERRRQKEQAPAPCDMYI